MVSRSWSKASQISVATVGERWIKLEILPQLNRGGTSTSESPFSTSVS